MVSRVLVDNNSSLREKVYSVDVCMYYARCFETPPGERGGPTWLLTETAIAAYEHKGHG